MAPIPLKRLQKGLKAHIEIPERIFPLSFPHSLGSLVVFWGMVRIRILGKSLGGEEFSLFFISPSLSFILVKKQHGFGLSG